jgi:hypothetical protein
MKAWHRPAHLVLKQLYKVILNFCSVNQVNKEQIVSLLVLYLPSSCLDSMCLQNCGHVICEDEVIREEVKHNTLPILSLGAKYCHYPHQLNIDETILATNNAICKVYWRKFFSTNTNAVIPPLFVKKDVTTLPERDIYFMNRLKVLEGKVKNVMDTSSRNIQRHNCLSNIEQQALVWLQNNPEWIIVTTDKNCGLACIKRSQYLRSLDDIVKDPNTFVEREKPNFSTRSNDIMNLFECTKWLDQYHASFSSRTCKPCVFEYIEKSLDIETSPNLKGIMKIHKSSSNPPARPIIPFCKSQLAGVHEFVHECIKHFLSRFDQCLMNSIELILKLQDMELDGDEVITVLDIKSMYTNLDLHEAKEVLLDIIRSDPDICGYWKDQLEPFWNEVLDYALFDAEFTHNGKFYRQTYGLSMGSSCAPVIANIMVGIRENSNNFTSIIGLLKYFRFLDDVLMITKRLMNESIESLASRIIRRNTNSNDRLQFDWSSIQSYTAHGLANGKCIVYLDVEIRCKQMGNGKYKFNFAMHVKPLSAYQYVPFRSAHPTNVKKAMIRGEICRRRLLTSDSKGFFKRMKHLVQCLFNRGYPRKFIAPILSMSDLSFNLRDDALIKYSSRVDKLRPCRFAWATSYNPSADLLLSSPICPLIIRFDPNKVEAVKKIKMEIAEFAKTCNWDVRIVIAYRRGSNMVSLYRSYRQPEARQLQI